VRVEPSDLLEKAGSFDKPLTKSDTLPPSEIFRAAQARGDYAPESSFSSSGLQCAGAAECLNAGIWKTHGAFGSLLHEVLTDQADQQFFEVIFADFSGHWPGFQRPPATKAGCGRCFASGAPGRRAIRARTAVPFNWNLLNTVSHNNLQYPGPAFRKPSLASLSACAATAKAWRPDRKGSNGPAFFARSVMAGWNSGLLTSQKTLQLVA